MKIDYRLLLAIITGVFIIGLEWGMNEYQIKVIEKAVSTNQQSILNLDMRLDNNYIMNGRGQKNARFN